MQYLHYINDIVLTFPNVVICSFVIMYTLYFVRKTKGNLDDNLIKSKEIIYILIGEHYDSFSGGVGRRL